MQIITSEISARSQPCRHAVERDQLRGRDTGPHQRPFAFAHKDFRHQRAGIVGAGFDRAIGAGAHDGEEVARLWRHQRTVERDEIA